MSPHALIGKKAPEISLPDAKGGTFKFTPGTSGRPTVVFFYPKSGSYGCTKQVCQFRDALSEKEIYRSSQVEIVGISPDPAPKQKAFVEKQNVPYPILSDEKGDARKAYGVSKGLFGLTASSRVTFVIDSEGIVRGALDNTINYAAHAKFVNNWLSSISQKAIPTEAAPPATTTNGATATNGAPAPAPAEAPAVPKKDEPSEAKAEAVPVAAETATAPEVPEKEAKPSESTSAPAVPEKEAATTTLPTPEPTLISIPAPALEGGAQPTEDNHSPAGRAPSPEPTPSKLRAELPAASIGNLNEIAKAEPEVAKQIEVPAAELTAAPTDGAVEQQSFGTTAAAAVSSTTAEVTVPVSVSPEVVVLTKTPGDAEPEVEKAAGGAVAPNGDAKEVTEGKQAEPGATPVVDQPAPTASPSN